MKLELVTDEIKNDRMIYNHFNESNTYYDILENINDVIKPLIFNMKFMNELLSEIIDEYYEYENIPENIRDEIKNEILKITENESENFYTINLKTFSAYKNNKPYHKEYYSYDRIFSDSYSILTILKIFDAITEYFNNKYKLTKGSVFEKFYNKNSCYELLEFIIDVLEKKFNNISFEDVLFRIKLNNNNILSNNHVYLSDEIISDEIYYDLIDYNIKESILSYLYESDILSVYSSDEINKYEIFESCLIKMYNNQYNTNMHYSFNKIESELYAYDYNIILEIHLSDILELNRIISESDENTDMIFNIIQDNKGIYELFKNTNNSIKSEIFIPDLFEIFSEELFNSFYDEYYYELNRINSSEYSFMKINDIYDLIRIVLNTFKHYNLNNSFKFKPELYQP